MPDQLGERIRSARRDAGFTNAESLAVKLGIGVRTLQRWEQGKSAPNVAKLILISQLTGHPLAYFVNGDEPVAA